MAILISSYIGSVLFHSFPKINKKVTQLEKNNIAEVLNKIVLISEIVYENLDDFEKESISSRKKILQSASMLPSCVIQDYYGRYLEKRLEKRKAQDLAYTKISNLDYLHDGHFFIIDINGTLLSSSSNMTNNSFLKDVPFMTKLSTEAYEKKEGFGRHKTSDLNLKSFETLVYLKWFKPWGIYIGAAVPINDIKQIISNREVELFTKLNNIIKSPNMAQVGQSYIFDHRGKILVSQDEAMAGLDIKDIKNPNTEKSLYDEFVQTAETTKVLHYKWNKPEDKTNYIYAKILWIDYIPKLQWYIVTTAYAEELEIMSNKLQKIIATSGIIVLFIALIISFIFFKKLLQPISTLSEMATRAIKGDYSVRSNIQSNDEIGELSKNFNMMIETIESNIKKEKQLVEHSRLAQMGEMMSMIAHQWRQPLGAIGSVTSYIKIQSEKYDLEDKKEKELFLNALNKKLLSIDEYVHFLSNTIDDFRTFFKKGNEKKSISLTTPIEKALEMIEASLNSKNIKIIKEYDCNKPIIVYKNELIQVILNILKNSEDNFTENNITNPIITITTHSNEKSSIIGIADNGGGVSSQILAKLFEPYFSTKLEKNGTGLGLYMSKVIVEEHHKGELKAKNVENGILFEIILHY